MNKLIELKNLTKNFDDQQVLRGINLDIYENEFLTLLGPSGCGKTTTLRIIAGFEEPSGGEVLFNGIEISKLPPYKREVNTVFQKFALFPHLNVAENIGFGLNLKKVDKDVIAQKVTRMLKMVGLEGFEKRDVTLLIYQRTGNGNSLLLSAGEQGDISFFETLQTYHFQHSGDFLGDHVLVHFFQIQTESNVLCHIQMGKKGIFLENGVYLSLIWRQIGCENTKTDAD